MTIATTFGIPIRLHWSFLGLVLLYAILSVLTVGIGGAWKLLLLAFVLFGSVVLHELGHAMAARTFGVETAHITLYPFGGIAAVTHIPTEPRQELLIALAGPSVNMVLFSVASSLWIITGGGLFLVFAGVNLMMGLFNLLPAFPMDGGRVLRALLAMRYGWMPASRLSLRIGRGFAWAFIVLGALTLSFGFLLIGGFLLFALASEEKRLNWMVYVQRLEEKAKTAMEASTISEPVTHY